MKCRQAQNLIQMEIDGLLKPDLAANLNRHLEECPLCAGCREEALALHALLSQNFVLEDAPEGFAAQIMENLPPQPAAKVTFFTKPWKRYALTAAAAFLVLAASSLFFGETPPLPDNNSLPVAENPTKNPSGPDNIENPINTELPTNPDQDIPPAINEPDNNEPNNNEDINQSASPDKKDTQKPQTPQENTGAQPQPGESGELYLPQVAYGSQTNGDFSLTLLADHNGSDAICPKVIAGGKVEYLVSASEGYQLWQQDISAKNPPELINEAGTSAMGANSGDSGEVDWSDNLDCFVAISPDSSMVAANIKGENGGLWFSDNNSSAKPVVLTKKAGGNLLAWAPNSGKIAFNDSLGRLYVAYPAESLVLMAFNGSIKSLSWSEDSKTLVFSGKKAQDNYTKIYCIQVP